MSGLKLKSRPSLRKSKRRKRAKQGRSGGRKLCCRHCLTYCALGHPFASGDPGFTSKPSGWPLCCRSRSRPDHFAAHAASVATPRRVSSPPSRTQVSRFRTHHSSSVAARRTRVCARRIAAAAVAGVPSRIRFAVTTRMEPFLKRSAMRPWRCRGAREPTCRA